MTDLSGIGSNKTFKTGVLPGAPYYYISAHLDLSNVVVPAQGEITYYFNKDNSLGYLLTPLSAGVGYDEYHKFHLIDSNSVIGEVVVYSNPDLVLGSGILPGNGIEFRVGGALDTVSPVLSGDEWAGQTGFASGPVNIADINTGSVCYFGHEGGGSTEDKQYLAVSIYQYDVEAPNAAPESAPVPDAPAEEESPVVIVDESRSLRAARKAKAKNVRQVVSPSIASGSLHVVVKVYPKYQ